MIEVSNYIKKSSKLELVYFAKEKIQTSFTCEVLEVLEDRIIAGFPSHSTEDFDIVPMYERLNLVMPTEDGVLTSNVNLLKKESGVNIVISFPYNNQFCQRRQDSRIPMHVDFELNINVASGTINFQNLKTKDISGKGIACITEMELPDFDNAQVILKLYSGEINAFCKKVYSRKINLDGTSMFNNGIAFTQINEDDIDVIVKECLKFQLTSMRNERLFETL